MDYRTAIKLRRQSLKRVMGADSPPATHGPSSRNTPGTELTISDDDASLLRSGDQEAISRRIAELEQQIQNLDAAIVQKYEEADGYHAAAVSAHDRIVQIFNDQINSEFSARNKIGEMLCAVYLCDILGVREGTLEIDRRVFQTPMGNRRLDAYLHEHRIAVESKVGYQSLTQRLRDEIEKDEYLLSSGALQQVHWIFYSRSSSRLLKRLRSGPIIVSEGWLTPEIKQRVFKHGQPDWLPL